MVVLRVLTADDWPLWRTLRLSALTEAPHAFKSRLSDWHRGDEERWRVRFENPASHHLVAFLGEDPVGMASCLPEDGDIRELRSVWVSPRARGRGVGDRLMTEIGEWAVKSGGTLLKLCVLPDNEPAIALYRRNGFVEAGHGELLADGVARELVMAKDLRHDPRDPR
jgi:ribosomal protein S18 acetylase RimI-like enzyme